MLTSPVFYHFMNNNNNNKTLAIIAIALAITMAAGLIIIGTIGVGTVKYPWLEQEISIIAKSVA